MVYVRGMTETCGHLASIRTKAVKDKMPKLKRIVELWNARCKEISLRAEDQLRSMGDESEWQKFYEADENPFEQRSVSRPLFPDPGVTVEHVGVNSRPQTVSSTERSTTESTSGTAKGKDGNKAGYLPEATRGRSDQPIVIKPLTESEFQKLTHAWSINQMSNIGLNPVTLPLSTRQP